jgi:hypothetical protein
MLRFSVFFVLLIAATAVNAETMRGIRFDQIPVGCRIYGQYSTGEKTVGEYVGKSGGFHRIVTREDNASRRPVRTTLFNDDGWMVRKEWATGQWEAFEPFSCFERPGSCSYAYTNIDGERKKFKGRVTKWGKDLVSSGGFAGEAPFKPTRLRLDALGITVVSAEGGTKFRVTRRENCEMPGV